MYGDVYHEDIENFLAIDEMIDDSNRMQADLDKQKKEFENKLKKQGKDFNRM
jgi:hypothetical protein